MSMEYDYPSKPFFQRLEMSWTLALQSLMIIDEERVMFLSLIEDIDYELDEPACAFWVVVLIWIGGWGCLTPIKLLLSHR
jgi:hypothetical protein